MKGIACILFVLGSAALQLRAQPEPTFVNGVPAFTTDNIWHKNIELVKSVRTPAATGNGGVGEYFQMFEENGRVYSLGTSGTYLHLMDITDPRNPVPALIIKATSIHNGGVERNVEFDRPVHWRNPHPTSSPLDQHVYAVVRSKAIDAPSTDVGYVAVVHDNEGKVTKLARFMVFDLTAALSHVAVYGSSSNYTIEIDDAAGRSSAHLGTNYTNTVYIGYIEKDVTQSSDHRGNLSPTVTGWEYMWVERMRGIFIVPSRGYKKCDGVYASYIDLFMLSSIATHVNISSSTLFVEPTRVLEQVQDCNNNTISMPIEVRSVGGARRPVKEARGYIRKKLDIEGYPMEGCSDLTNCYYLNKIDLYIASYGRPYQMQNEWARQIGGYGYDPEAPNDPNNVQGNVEHPDCIYCNLDLNTT